MSSDHPLLGTQVFTLSTSVHDFYASLYVSMEVLPPFVAPVAVACKALE